MRHIPRLSPAMAVALAALVLAATGGAVAAVGDGGTIDGCVTRTGEIRLLEAEGSPPCAASESPIAWNLQGPKGEPGEPGSRRTPQDVAIEDDAVSTLPEGVKTKPSKVRRGQLKLIQVDPAPGEALEAKRIAQFAIPDWFVEKKYAQVAYLPLPAGKWVVNAKASSVQIAGPDYPASFQGRIECYLLTVKGIDRGGALHGTVALQQAYRGKAGNVELYCTGWSAAVSNVRIAAIRVGKLTQRAY